MESSLDLQPFSLLDTLFSEKHRAPPSALRGSGNSQRRAFLPPLRGQAARALAPGACVPE